jgi:hypothetical protein
MYAIHGDKENKNVKTMKYETPEMTALSAINVVQGGSPSTKPAPVLAENYVYNELTSAYADWEE